MTMAAVALSAAACPDSAPPQPDVQVEDAWVRAVSGSDVNTAAYMTLRNRGDAPDRLTGARAEAARMTGVHRTTIDSTGLARMREVDALDLPAGSSVALEPGGYHLMLMGVGPLAAGDTIEITLLLEASESLDIAAEVRAF
ncbi:MAG: copper chaperone PCu(A)C [Gemmatimonadetes bacterium]|nr:copper chaperone PCu(A)C [Gemmatimonadota bacterium]